MLRVRVRLAGGAGGLPGREDERLRLGEPSRLETQKEQQSREAAKLEEGLCID